MERMNNKNIELKKKKGYGIRTLISMCTKGIDNMIRRPGYEVNFFYNDNNMGDRIIGIGYCSMYPH